MRTWLTALGVAGIGLGLLYLTSAEPSDGWFAKHPGLEAFVTAVAATLLSTAVLFAIWELAAKRAFVREIRAEIDLEGALKNAGLIGLSDDFSRELAWERVLQCDRLDVWISYAKTWRNTNRESLRALAQRKGAVVRIFLPDPHDPGVVAELANRYKNTKAGMAETILEASNDFQEIFRGKPGFELWHVAVAPVFSFYRFDNHAFITFYKHRRGRDYTPPTIVFDDGGYLWKFLEREISAFTEGETPLGKRIG